ncbi:MAG: lyase family protein, partial [Candidatus Binatia bacterium]
MARGKQLWAGRINASMAHSVEAFTSSIAVDRRLYRCDITGSIAHVKMLARQRIILLSEAQKIVRGLKAIEREIEGGNFPFSSADEDIHMNIERRLTKKIGAVAGKLHTARSRNDQVALDMRLYLREELKVILDAIRRLKLEIGRAARRNLKVIMPGYTHLQRAQPVLFSHHLL